MNQRTFSESLSRPGELVACDVDINFAAGRGTVTQNVETIIAARPTGDVVTDADLISVQEVADTIGVMPPAVIATADTLGIDFDPINPQFTVDEMRSIAIPILRDGAATGTVWEALIGPQT